MEEIVEFHAQDLHAEFVNDQQQQDQMNQSQIWLHDDPNQQQHQIHQNFMSDDDNTIMLYSDFPLLPDLPCMSSSSSSSSTLTPVKASASSLSTSSSSSAFVSPPQPAETGFNSLDCTDEMMMDTFGYGDLLKHSNEFFNPACIFQNEEQEDDPLENLNLESFEEVEMEDLMMNMHEEDGNKNDEGKQNDVVVEEDMAKVFLEWLRSNRQTVSADDLKNVRIKKATIDSAAHRLGGGKEGMKQLLKLVLEWVQTNHLHKRKFKDVNEIDTQNLLGSNLPCTQTLPPPLYSPPMPGYVPCGGGDVYDSGHHGFLSHYQLLDPSLGWSNNCIGTSSSHFNSFYDNFAAGPPPTLLQPPQAFAAGYSGGHEYPYAGGQYFHGQGGGGGDNGSVRLDSSATKEARKKRMARQRRFSAHHRQIHHGNSHQNHYPTRLDTNTSDNCTMATAARPDAGIWVNLPSPTGAGVSTATSSGFPVHSLPVPAVDQPNSSVQNQNYSPHIVRQGWKPEKNLRFLLQKVLKQSDVGNLGRIVLPKKEAETHLPELDEKDGISIAMEDIATSRVWNMRYRYWPNNRSRMYLLENTADFVKANGLQEGDFIVIYSDVKLGKFMIRGVTVRQPRSKPESKRAGKSQRSNPTTAANGTSSLLMTDATPKRQ